MKNELPRGVSYIYSTYQASSRRLPPPSWTATSASGGLRGRFGPACTQSNSLGTQICTFVVWGPGRESPNSLRTAGVIYSICSKGCESIDATKLEKQLVSLDGVSWDLMLGAEVYFTILTNSPCAMASILMQ